MQLQRENIPSLPLWLLKSTVHTGEVQNVKAILVTFIMTFTALKYMVDINSMNLPSLVPSWVSLSFE
jgi:hypothetical protein